MFLRVPCSVVSLYQYYPSLPPSLPLCSTQKLLDLNNIHSLKAVVSALQSRTIFRLTQTWKCVHKKDKAVYERLQDFVSETDNWSAAPLLYFTLTCSFYIPYVAH